jgi:hypothetical protein
MWINNGLHPIWWNISWVEKKNNILNLYNINIPDIVKPLLKIKTLENESILFHNYVFKAFDNENFSNIEYLQELFLEKLKSSNTWSWNPKIIDKWNEIIIEWYKKFQIKIIKEDISDKIIRNSIIIEIKNKEKALNPWDKWTLIQLFMILRKLDWFIFEYINDTFEIEKNKDLREKLKVSNEETKEMIKNDLNTLDTVSDNKWVIVAWWWYIKDKININNIYAIKRNLSWQFSNAISYYKWLQDKANLLLESTERINWKDRSEEMKYFNEIVIADFTKWIEIMSNTISRLENDMISVAYIKNHKDIVEKMQMNLEWWEIVTYRKQESKIMYWIKNTTEKILWFFWKNK